MDSKPEIIEEIPISMFELKDEVSKIKKRDGELNFRVQRTEEYLNQFVVFSLKKGKEFVSEIEALNIPRLKPEHIYKVIDIMPGDIESMKLLFQGYTINVTQENMKKLVDIVKKHA